MEAPRPATTFSLAYERRGFAFGVGKGENDNAVTDYDEAIRLKPDFGDAYAGRGLARETKGDSAGALDDYRTALRLLPELDAAHRPLLARIAAIEAQAVPGSLPAQPRAATLADADAAYQRGEYTAAVTIVRPLAEAGNPDAEMRLGYNFDMGQGVPQNSEVAAIWYRKAAEQGHAEAEYALGGMYEDGRGVGKDLAEAAKWYRLAAAQGDAAAREHLSVVEQRIAVAKPPVPVGGPDIRSAGALPANGGAAIKVQTITEDGQNTTIISVDGELKLGDEKRFADAAIGVSDAIVDLNSPGGNLVAGIEIGKAIRLKGFSTLVPHGFQCASACALAWLAGNPRYMGVGATIGFHAAFVANGEQIEVSPDANAMVGAYSNQLGLPLSAILYITAAKPDHIRWLTFDDAKQYGIDVREFPIR